MQKQKQAERPARQRCERGAGLQRHQLRWRRAPKMVAPPASCRRGIPIARAGGWIRLARAPSAHSPARAHPGSGLALQAPSDTAWKLGTAWHLGMGHPHRIGHSCRTLCQAPACLGQRLQRPHPPRSPEPAVITCSLPLFRPCCSRRGQTCQRSWGAWTAT